MSNEDILGVAQAGVDGMDKEHAVEIQMVRALEAALRSSDDSSSNSDVVGELFDQLESFTAAHFMSEQLLMRLHSYPGYQAHQQEHDDLMDRLGVIRRSIESGELSDANEAVGQLEEWLETHIHTEDDALATFLKDPGMHSTQVT